MVHGDVKSALLGQAQAIGKSASQVPGFLMPTGDQPDNLKKLLIAPLALLQRQDISNGCRTLNRSNRFA